MEEQVIWVSKWWTKLSFYIFFAYYSLKYDFREERILQRKKNRLRKSWIAKLRDVRLWINRSWQHEHCLTNQTHAGGGAPCWYTIEKHKASAIDRKKYQHWPQCKCYDNRKSTNRIKDFYTTALAMGVNTALKGMVFTTALWFGGCEDLFSSTKI